VSPPTSTTGSNPSGARKLDLSCRCSPQRHNLSVIRYKDRSGRWTLHRYYRHGIDPKPPAINDKRCPDCGADFSTMSIDQVLEAAWPGGSP